MPGSRWTARVGSSPAACPPTWVCTGAATVRTGVRTTPRAAVQAIGHGTGADGDDVRTGYGIFARPAKRKAHGYLVAATAPTITAGRQWTSADAAFQIRCAASLVAFAETWLQDEEAESSNLPTRPAQKVQTGTGSLGGRC
jgi:hypothetical protein